MNWQRSLRRYHKALKHRRRYRGIPGHITAKFSKPPVELEKLLETLRGEQPKPEWLQAPESHPIIGYGGTISLGNTMSREEEGRIFFESWTPTPPTRIFK